MKEHKMKARATIEDPLKTLEEFYDPFQHSAQKIIKFETKNTQDLKCSMALFQDTTDEEENDIFSSEEKSFGVMKSVDCNADNGSKFFFSSSSKPSILSKVIANSKNPKKQPSRLPNMAYKENKEYYGFNSRCRVNYPQTPGFKSLLESPFGKFNHLFKDIISTLSKNNDGESLGSKNQNYEIVELDTNPLNFYNAEKMSFETSKYFIGIAMKFQEMNLIPECLYFCHLACYADPFSEKPWRKYVTLLEEQGKLEEASIMAKSGFLLTQSEELMKSFLSNGEKCELPLYKLQGLICSVSNPEIFEKSLLPESAKLQIKYGTIWKGLKILFEICRTNEFKLSVCQHTLFLTKYLENLGFIDEALYILKSSFSKSMSKLEIYLLYIEMSMRKYGILTEETLQEVLKYSDCISGENRYRLFLEISLIMYKNNDERYYSFLWKSFTLANELCAPGAGLSKTLKQIYFSYAKITGVKPQPHRIEGDQVVFELNMHNFVNEKPLIEYEFSDWKYYLHYGVAKRTDLLENAVKKFQQTGRIIAEWIHCLRETRNPLSMLKIWREKIDEVPKSGELWCEGGRIYAELGEYQNAEKCFKYAIHFTPQYGDSFIEQLRILLKDARFLEISKLKKLFLVCEPFYGHVLSYLKLNHWQKYPLTLNEVWENAVYEISQDLYNTSFLEREKGSKLEHLFTAYAPYNRAYSLPDSAEVRQRIFSSYEQMENKT